MKKQLIVITLGLNILFAAVPVVAKQGNSYIDRAKVLHTEPIYETVTVSQPQERCWNERSRHQRQQGKSYTGTIAGSLIGGVVGNQFGRGRGKDIMTVAGALLGASIGHDVSQQSRSGFGRSDRRCKTVGYYEERQEIVGYRVKYRYKGNIFWTRTQEYPGRHIKVRVKVRPLHDNY